MKGLFRIRSGRVLIPLVLAVSPFYQLAGSGDASRQNPLPVLELLNQLPSCSLLREEVGRGLHGDGTKKPYMEAMHREGIERVLLEVYSIWRGGNGGRPTQLQIVTRLYFDKADGPNSQIADPARLARIQESGTQAELDKVARERVTSAPFRGGDESPLLAPFDWVRHLNGTKAWSRVELFANPWLPEEPVLAYPRGTSLPQLKYAAMLGDAATVLQQIKAGHFRPGEINAALGGAVRSRYDNSTVIKALLHSGADVNARGEYGITLVMSAVDRPCNLRALLEYGARIDERDATGITALGHARRSGDAESVRLLQQAGAKE